MYVMKVILEILHENIFINRIVFYAAAVRMQVLDYTCQVPFCLYNLYRANSANTLFMRAYIVFKRATRTTRVL